MNVARDIGENPALPSAAAAPVPLLAGRGFLESPRWARGALWFSDFSSRQVSSIDEGGRVTSHYYVAGQPSGLGFLPDGDLLIASMYDGRVLRGGANGSLSPLADLGKLHRGCLGDMAVSPAGRIYVSTLPDMHGHDPAAVPTCPILMVDRDGEASVVASGIRIPNGLAVTPDELSLIVAETQGCRLLRFSIAADGSLGEPSVFADLAGRKPDGLCLDPSGGAWVCSPFTGELLFVGPDGGLEVVLKTGGEWAVACALDDRASRLFLLTAQITLDDFRRGGGKGSVLSLELERTWTDGAPLPAEPDYDFSGLGFEPGQRAVVSGAASGIGRSVARILARSGLDVLAWDIDEPGLATLAEESVTGNGAVRPMRVDGTDPEDIARAWRTVADLPIQFLANNAGPPSGSPLSVEDGIRLAVGGYAAMTEAFLADHQEVAQSIVFTASVAGSFMASPVNPDWYPTAKAGIVGYSRHLAVKYRGRPRANAIAPGFTITARTAPALASPGVAEKLARYPMGRGAYAWEAASLICFLLSPAASFINGVLVPVDGASSWIQ